MSTDPRTATDPDRDAPLRVGVLLFDGVEPLDAIGPAQVFWSLDSARRAVEPFRPIEVLLVAETMAPVTAGYGLVIHPTVDYVTCPQLDVLIVPGGTGGEDDDATARIGRRFQSHHPATLSFIQAQDARTEVTASVCTGTFILAGAGLMANRRGNTHWYSRDELVGFIRARGEAFELVTERVVDDGHVVTAGGVSSGIELALHLVGRLLGDVVRTAVHAIIERETPGDRARVRAD